MNWSLQRRAFIKGGLTAGIGLTLGGRALAKETVAVAASASAATPYERRILDIAASQIERVGTRVWRNDLVGVADFAQPSWTPRLHFANLEAGTVRSFLLAPGRSEERGVGNEWVS